MKKVKDKDEYINGVLSLARQTEYAQQKHMSEFLYEVADYLKSIDDKPKVGEWIPVEEELPKYTDEYNVTVGVASEFGYFEKATTLRFENIKGKESKWVLPTSDIYRVIAWQELPQPYREKVE